MFVGTIENLNKPKVFYMVYVEGSNTPQKKHEVYEDAFQEMQRLSKKENKICYVLKSIVQVEQIPKITKLIEECENFFIPSKAFTRKR